MRTAVFCVLLGIAAGCGPAGEPGLSPAAKQNVAVVTQLFRHFNDHDWTAMASLYEDPAEFIDPSFGTDAVTRTRAETAEKYAELQRQFPDIRDDVVRILPSGDTHVTVQFVSGASAPDGSRWSLPICTVFELRDGRIVKDHTYYDNN